MEQPPHQRQPSYPVDDAARRRAKVPHELFLTNLIGNHILAFVALLGMASHNPLPVLAVPLLSFLVLAFTLWRGGARGGGAPPGRG
ncbi:MAG TPA: hypothetical protein VIX81_04445, partial [Gammaproteobacteria bacterium]